MKKAKRILVFAILAAMLLSLCGCGMFRTRVAKAAIKMSKLDSLHADVEMQIGMGISLLGQDVNADAAITGGADIQRDPERVYVNRMAEVAGFEQNLLFYGVGRDDGFDVYSSVDSGDSWTKGSVEDDDSSKNSKADGKSLFLLLSESAASFKEYGKEKVNGSDAIGYNGKITSDELRQALELATAKQALEESLDVELDDDVFEDLGDVPVSIWIDVKSGMIVRVEMDMSDVMQGLVPVLVDKAMEKTAICAETNKIFADKDVREAYDVRLKKLFFKNEKMPAWGDIEGRIKEIADRIALFQTYRKERENAVGDVTQQKPTFSKISVYPDNAGHWFIRCKVGGEQLTGEKLSPEDAERYNAALAAKDKDKLAGLREELAEKYLAGQIGNSCERKRSY